MKQNFCWKVVRKIGGRFTSLALSADNPYRLKYQLGKRTRAKIGSIFAFRTRHGARLFKKNLHQDSVVLKCINEDDVFDLLVRCSKYIDSHSIQSFWNRGKEYRFITNTQLTPSETIGVDSLIPVEISH
jgi:hypothetical protein